MYRYLHACLVEYILSYTDRFLTDYDCKYIFLHFFTTA